MDPTALFAAIRNRDVPTITRLVDAGCDLASIEPGQYKTPLQLATGRGHAEVVKLLLDRGAPVDGRSKTGRTALFDAVIAFDPQVIAMLVAAGADVNAADGAGETPIWMVHTWQQFELLLHHGANVRAPNASGTTLLWRMVELTARSPDDAIPILDKLLELGLRVEDVKPDDRGYSVVMEAISSGESSARVASWLLDRGADARHATDGGITALHCACHHDNLTAVKALIERGADPNAQVTSEFGPYEVGWRPVDAIGRRSRCRGELVATLLAAGQAGREPAMALAIDGDEIAIDSRELGAALDQLLAITKDVPRNVFAHPDYESADRRLAWKFSTGITERELFARCAADRKLRPRVAAYVTQIVAANRAGGGDPLYVHDELEAGGNAMEALVAAGKPEDVTLLKQYIESIDLDHTVQLHDLMRAAREAYTAKQLAAIDALFEELGFEDASRATESAKPRRAKPRAKRKAKPKRKSRVS